MTYYLKYRPQTLEDLDLDSVREQLKKIVSSGNIPHALLFAGPKGTGKTSAARIIAKIVNCEKQGKKLTEPCNKCGQCKSIAKGNNIDVIELDAASNRGIDDVRVLRDTIKLSPASAKKKVYIIDEAHMLTLEASNALLKTLEEPPEHVVFILATTNAEKLIETIRSRTTLIEFHKASPEETVRSLRSVVKGEKLKIDKETLLSISEMSDGSFRDAVKILEQLVSQKVKLEKAEVEEYLFKRKAFNEKEFINTLSAKDAKKALLGIEYFVTKGVSVENVIDSLITVLRESLLTKVGLGGEEIPNLSKENLISLIELLTSARSQIAFSPIEELPLERLSKDEVNRVIDVCLENANKQNMNKTSIESDAKELLISLAEGFPHFIQQFGYSAFALDSDDIISKQDVEDSAFGSRGALEIIGDRYYRYDFYEKIQKESYRQVLRIMADDLDEWVPREKIKSKFKGESSILNNAIKALRDRHIILSKEGERGTYRLQHKGFALWIKLRRQDYQNE